MEDKDPLSPPKKHGGSFNFLNHILRRGSHSEGSNHGSQQSVSRSAATSGQTSLASTPAASAISVNSNNKHGSTNLEPPVPLGANAPRRRSVGEVLGLPMGRASDAKRPSATDLSSTRRPSMKMDEILTSATPSTPIANSIATQKPNPTILIPTEKPPAKMIDSGYQPSATKTMPSPPGAINVQSNLKEIDEMLQSLKSVVVSTTSPASTYPSVSSIPISPFSAAQSPMSVSVLPTNDPAKLPTFYARHSTPISAFEVSASSTPSAPSTAPGYSFDTNSEFLLNNAVDSGKDDEKDPFKSSASPSSSFSGSPLQDNAGEEIVLSYRRRRNSSASSSGINKDSKIEEVRRFMSSRNRSLSNAQQPPPSFAVLMDQPEPLKGVLEGHGSHAHDLSMSPGKIVEPIKEESSSVQTSMDDGSVLNLASAAGIWQLLEDIGDGDFTDHKYKVWRQAMFNMLKSELDYPLLPPSDLMAFINEETCT